MTRLLTNYLLRPGALAWGPPKSWYTNIGLHRTAACHLWWGLSSSTRQTYDTARRSYITHFALGGTTALPPSAASPCHLVAYLGHSGRTMTTNIKLYLTGLWTYCVDLGLANFRAFEVQWLQRILQSPERLPMARDILRCLSSGVDQIVPKTETSGTSNSIRSAATLPLPSPPQAIGPPTSIGG